MPSHYAEMYRNDWNSAAADEQLLQQILKERGQDWGQLLEGASGRGQPIPLGDLGRELVKRKEAIMREIDFDRTYNNSERRANPGGPIGRLVSQGMSDPGMDALLGALRIAEITGGNAETPSFKTPEFGELSTAQIRRARGPFFQQQFGSLPGGDGPPYQSGPPVKSETNPDLDRLRTALANQAKSAMPPGVQDPRMTMGVPKSRKTGQDFGVTQQAALGDIRRRTPWALIETMLPFGLE